jgi:hypothetical protein
MAFNLKEELLKLSDTKPVVRESDDSDDGKLK